MKKQIYFLLIFILFSPIYAQSNKYRIDGKSYCKQIYDDKNNQITFFKNWELIEKFYVSPDDTKMLVYHRPDKSRAFLITLYDLNKNQIIAECEPGWGCAGVIFTDKFLIYKWATSGGGTRFEYRDYNTLKVEKTISSYFPFEDIENNILICASYHYSDDEICLYNLSDGSVIQTVNLEQELLKKGIYSDATSMRDIKRTGNKTYEFTFIYYHAEENTTMISVSEDNEYILEIEL